MEKHKGPLCQAIRLSKITRSQATVNLLHSATGLYARKEQTYPVALIVQEQTIAVAGANAGAHSTYIFRESITAFLLFHDNIV